MFVRRNSVVAAFAFLAILVTGTAHAKMPEREITLDIVGADAKDPAFQMETGFPITIRMQANEPLGIARRDAVETNYPLLGGTAFIVFDDPDGCLSLALDFDVPELMCPPEDETYLEFTPDRDAPGILDRSGSPAQMVYLSDVGGEPTPSVLTFNPDSGLNDLPSSYGPAVGGPDTAELRCVGLHPSGLMTPCVVDADCSSTFDEVCTEAPVTPDGYGLGANDDLPGLVFLVDASVGLVRDENFALVEPVQARNLAGLFDSVAYDLNDSKDKTAVITHTVVPAGAFTPLSFWDNCIGAVTDPTSELCEGGPDGPALFRIEDGPIFPGSLGEWYAAMPTYVVTGRAFVVNGPAPNILTDENGDGLVDDEDAELAGYVVISNVEEMRYSIIKLAFQLPEFTLDLDGNGLATGAIVLPGGPGSVVPIPR